MKIGTDVDMSTNIAEGYMIMEFKKRELITKGKLNREVYVRFYKHCPDYVLFEMYGTDKLVGQPTIMEDTTLSAEDVWETYLEDKDSIDSFCGVQGRIFPQDEYDLLNLASDVSSYKGLA